MKNNRLFLFLLLIGMGSNPLYGQDNPQPLAEKPAEELITLHFDRADIRSVLEILATKGNVNIVAGPEVKGDVTVNLQNVTWKTAFETITQTYGFDFEQEGNLYKVFTEASLAGRRNTEVRSEAFLLRYVSLEEVKKALKEIISSSGKIESIPGSNQVLVRDTASNLKEVRRLIESVDQPHSQVHIDAKIVRTALTEGENMGIDWNVVARITGAARPVTFPFSLDADSRNPDRALRTAKLLPRGQTAQTTTTNQTSGGGQTQDTKTDFPNVFGFPFAKPADFTFGTIDFTQFSAVLNMIKSRKNTKIISNPRIVVLNHQPARVQVGGEVGIPLFERNETTGSFQVSGFEPRNFGVVLQVTPHITEKGEILVHVTPEITSFLGFLPIGGTNLATPQFDTIVAETNVMIQSGDTLMIGGLIGDEEDNNRNRVPYLSRVPILGWLFKSVRKEAQQNRKTETIFFITVALSDPELNRQALKQWDRKQREYDAFKKYSEEVFLKGEPDPAKQKPSGGPAPVK